MWGELIIQENTFISIRCYSMLKGWSWSAQIKRYHIIICLYIILCCRDSSGFTKHVFVMNRIHCLRLPGRDSSWCSHFSVCPTLWANTYGGVHWNLFSHGLSHGLFIIIFQSFCTNYNFESAPCSSYVRCFFFICRLCLWKQWV